METTNVAYSGVVREVLTKDNYKTWKVVLKHYLMGQGLWDVVESDSDSKFISWRRMKNAKALHIIQLSCDQKILDEIIHFQTAKDAWNHLSAQYGTELKAKPDIEQGVLDDSLRGYKELYRQVERGKLPTAYLPIFEYKDAEFPASALGRTFLHVAVIAGQVNIVDKLVKLGKDRLVKMKDKEGYTALALAAYYTGNIDIAKCMVEKQGWIRSYLLTMENKNGEIPVLQAADNGHKEMTRYLYHLTPPEVFDRKDSSNRFLLFSRCITSEIFDVALKLLQRWEDLPSESLSHNFSTLLALAKMPSAFPSGCRFGFGQQFIYSILSVERKFEAKIADILNMEPFVADEERQKTSLAASLGRFCRLIFISPLLLVKLLGRLLLGIVYLFVEFFRFLNFFGIREIYDQKYTHYQVLGILMYLYKSTAEFNDSQLEAASAYEAMLHAAKHGIVELINAMRKANPDLLWAMDSSKRSIFSYAILNRKQNVFQLIHGLNGRKEIISYRTDMFGNNLLHLAGHLGPSSDLDSRSGAALQMQREIQWFKAVEEVVHPKCKEAKNGDGKKPHELFNENHKELVKNGEKWAKDTAQSFTVVGILITTIMFAAAFTVPGGNNPETGEPIFLRNKIFAAYFIADAISLICSATSVLIFIGILTSRYAEKDFLKSLPWKLLSGLFFLFLSVVSMIVAFCAAVAIILKGYREYRWLVIGGTLSLGSVPIIVLLFSQLRLLYDIFGSTRSNPISYIKKVENQIHRKIF